MTARRCSPSLALLLTVLALRAADPLATWTVRNPLPTPNDLRAVATGTGLVVAVGTAGTIVTSADAGETWALQSSGVTNVIHDLVGVAFGAGRFVALPASGAELPILTSVNGTNWATNSTLLSNNTFFTAITFGGGTFVAVGYGSGTNRIWTSTDGLSWTQRTSGISDILNAVTYAQNQFVAVGGTAFPTNRGFILTSPDGVAWTIRRTNVPALYAGVAGNGSGFVAVGNRLTSRSTDGVAWTDATDLDLTFKSTTPDDAGSYHVVVCNEFGCQASAPATLTVTTVAVAVSPKVLYLFTGTTGAFNAVVTGATPAGYEWRKNSSPIAGATNASLVFTNAQPSNTSGFYFVTATFPFGSADSTNSGQLVLINDLSEINLYYDTTYQSVPAGTTVGIAADVAGPAPLGFQWRKNDVPIPGATNATLVFTNAQPTNSADYSYSVTYALGSLTNTSTSTLLVYSNAPPVFVGSGFNDANTYRLTFTGLTNRYYQVDYATNLNPPVVWTPYDTPLLTTNPFSYSVFLPNLTPSPRHFFRVQILPP